MRKLLTLSLLLLSSHLAALPAQAEGDGKPAETDGSYVLRPNDVVRLEVYQEPDLSGAVRILNTGEVSFPLIGSLRVAGLSVNQAVERIRELYAANYLVDPKLTLTVFDYATDFISVIGAVRSAGQIPIPVSGNIDLASAMAIVGGLSATADANNIELVRASGAKSTFSMASIVDGSSGTVALRAGDRVIVRESPFVGKTVTILGQVGSQGPVPFPVDGRLDLVTAIAAAGGLGDLASPSKITINRGGQVVTVDYRDYSSRADSPPLLLLPGDIINVPERRF